MSQMIYGRVARALLHIVPVALVVVVPLSVHAGVFATLLAHQDTVPDVPSEVPTYDAQTTPLLRPSLSVTTGQPVGGGDVIIDSGSLVPSGDITNGKEEVNTKTNSGEISLYTVRPADTLSQIAEMFDVSANTILWANNITKASLIHPGDELLILPITGVRHVVKKGDTIASIAKKYDGNVDDILAYNQLASADDISVGDTIVIPGGEVATPVVHHTAPRATKTSGASPVRVAFTGGGSAGFTNPLPAGICTQGLHGYNGVDIGAPIGTPIYAAASGNVIVLRGGSGWNGGYGNYVVVSHPNGTQTLYAHMSRIGTSLGAAVSQGQVIGYVGQTGHATGPHLHFEVRGARNPFCTNM